MTHHKLRRAVFPGTFDPITLGHIDLIQRGSDFFDELIVMVGENPEKKDLFSVKDRVAMIRENVTALSNVSVQYHPGLTLDFVRSVGADILLRGIRDSADLRSELQQANTNRIVGDVETLFLMTTERYALISSTLIKQIVSLGGYNEDRLSELVPANVARRLKDTLGN